MSVKHWKCQNISEDLREFMNILSERSMAAHHDNSDLTAICCVTNALTLFHQEYVDNFKASYVSLAVLTVAKQLQTTMSKGVLTDEHTIDLR